MIVTSNEVLSVSYKPSDPDATGMLKCEVAYIKHSQMPECLFIRKWEDTKYQNPAQLLSKPVSLGWRWSIRLKNYNLTFNDEKFAYKMFNLLIQGSFEGCDLSERFPEYFL